MTTTGRAQGADTSKQQRGCSPRSQHSSTGASAAEVGQDPAYAQRSVTEMYRTTPLRGLWNPPQLRGPYFHDGSAATLEAVVEHYNTLRTLGLTAQQKSDLVHYLKSL